MTREQFRRMALRLPGSSEQSHLGHPISASVEKSSRRWTIPVKVGPSLSFYQNSRSVSSLRNLPVFYP